MPMFLEGQSPVSPPVHTCWHRCHDRQRRLLPLLIRFFWFQHKLPKSQDRSWWFKDSWRSVVSNKVLCAGSYVACWQRFLCMIQTPLNAGWGLEWRAAAQASSRFFLSPDYNLLPCPHSDEAFCDHIAPQILISEKLWVPGGSSRLGRRTMVTECTKGNWEFCHYFKAALENT